MRCSMRSMMRSFEPTTYTHVVYTRFPLSLICYKVAVMGVMAMVALVLFSCVQTPTQAQDWPYVSDDCPPNSWYSYSEDPSKHLCRCYSNAPVCTNSQYQSMQDTCWCNPFGYDTTYTTVHGRERTAVGCTDDFCTRASTDSCQYANDGECDIPNLCDPGTDCSDCHDGCNLAVQPPPHCATVLLCYTSSSLCYCAT
jgi:hypothetical protein